MSKLLAFGLIAAHAQAFSFRTNDVLAFLGGTDVVTAQQSGHLETLLTLHYRSLNLRFRNFGWEGDTVFAQPRDFGFPSLEQHVKNAGATVIVCEFGRAEALEGHTTTEFVAAYSKFLARFTNQTSRILLVIPPRFEHANAPLPDLTRHNTLLADYDTAILRLGYPTIDLSRLTGLTEDGLQITEHGHAIIAAEFARQLGIDAATHNSPAFDKLRQTVIAKNRLCFDFWRPQNWAFLGGDRTSVPSSRDHRDPKIRWFPSEMEKFSPLIVSKEAEIRRLAGSF
ncbi:MAG TPA: hypothetical protein VJ063_03610 [Verrucomicrobiae bacterium]|nr:hypothetical protein [Verrucomicrobiae bacterium]